MRPEKIYLLGALFLLLATLACNASGPQTTPTPEITNTQLPPSEVPSLAAQLSETPTPTATLIPASPTITFTPMPVSQLASNRFFDFTIPLPSSTSLANPDALSGVIYNGYGPVADAVVSLSRSSCGEPFVERRTDGQGRYVFVFLPAGTYFLQVEGTGLISLCGEEIRKSSGVGLSRDFIRPFRGLVMIAPTDRAAVQTLRPLLEWTAVPEAAYYVVELTVQTSGEPGWGANWTGAYLGTWLTNSTTFALPFDISADLDYKLNIIAFTAGQLPLQTAFDIRFHY